MIRRLDMLLQRTGTVYKVARASRGLTEKPDRDGDITSSQQG